MLTFFRIIRTGILSFWRNRWLSLATVLILVISLSILTGLVLVSKATDSLVAEIRDKVDVSAYFLPETTEEDILAVKEDLNNFPDIAQVTYISREEALLKFRDAHSDNEVILQSLDEIGDNPLEASLNIKATQASAYKAIANFLESKYSDYLDKVNYRETANIINRLFNITDTIRKVGLLASAILLFIAFLVTFNTVRLAIFSMREEISIMRLVGASNFFIRGPFLVEGILGGFLASIITFASFYAITYFLAPPISGFLSGLNLFSYYSSHLLYIFGLQLAVGVAVGIVSSTIAIRRYLEA
ncbi:MAG: Cell division protein [Parcubacteria group bacterium GW2011_GWB1_40_14]|nr:MAG: Cell division protein [Parcubacteria group bacterium GW2011_GWB1_40_14]